MKLSKDFFYTIKDNVSEEETNSGKLLVKSGMIKKVSNGVYLKTPIGLKVMENIEKIIRKNMEEVGVSEVSMPTLLPMELFEKAERKEAIEEEAFCVKDKHNRVYILGSTYEELSVQIAMNKIKSYKDLPLSIYQIGTKYRNESEPKLGLIRLKEFTMKDAYSFDKDSEGLDKSYKTMIEAYKKIFKDLGIEYIIVNADTGITGGTKSDEFQALIKIGEDTLVICDKCDYAANIEISKNGNKIEESTEKEEEMETIFTPHAGTIEELATFLGMPASSFVKTMIYEIDGKFYACMVNGDRDINETKLARLLNATNIKLAELEDVREITKAEIGFAGPVGLEIPVILDEELQNKKNFIVGANKTDHHIKNVNLKDFKIEIIADIKKVKEGDLCPKCGGKLVFKKGVEIGNIFKLGTKYSESLGLNYLGDDNKPHPVEMGSYELGLDRILSIIVEQNSDERGIVWPINVAPYKVAIIVIKPEDEEQSKLAEKLYNTLNELGIDTLLDDRKERAGVKFNDMDLIGIPVRITIGKNITEGVVEMKVRKSEEAENCKIEDIIENVKEKVEKLTKK